MSLRDKFRWEGYVNNTLPTPIEADYTNSLPNYETFIMITRDFQHQDISSGRYKAFNSLYDVAAKNKGNYIEVNNNYQSIQDPPNLSHLKR